MLKKLFGDKQFYSMMFAVAIPIALQNLISSSLNMMDTVIIGKLGEANIAAVGLANQCYFLLNLVLFGTYSGTSIFIAQFWGKKDIQNIRRVLGIALFTGVSISIVFSASV
jgi:Na+-driven multidrug efflux pump